MPITSPHNPSLEIGKSLRDRLRDDAIVIGPWGSIPHTSVVEILARGDIDFIMFDGEHSPIPPSALGALLPSAELHRCPSLLRCPCQSPDVIKQALDAGASGVMIPMVGSAAEARSVVAAARYAPAGNRGIGPWRASGYYADESYTAEANESTTLILQIETEAGLAACEEIAAVEGYDVLYVGPADLGSALGLGGQDWDERMIGALEKVSRAARANGKALGIDLPSLDKMPMLQDLGYHFFTYDSDIGFLTQGSAAWAADVRGG